MKGVIGIYEPKEQLCPDPLILVQHVISPLRYSELYFCVQLHVLGRLLAFTRSRIKLDLINIIRNFLTILQYGELNPGNDLEDTALPLSYTKISLLDNLNKKNNE